MVDEQVVAYEVEIDSFDVKYDEEEHDGQGTQDEPFSHDEPSTSGYHHHYQFPNDVDPNDVYLFDEFFQETDQIHQLDPNQLKNNEEIDDVEYIDQSVPSTSSMMTSLPSTVAPVQPNTYYRRKSGGPTATGNEKPNYRPLAFQTTYVNSVTQYGRRVVTKRIHESIDPTSNSINEESEILQKIQMEIEILTKENDLLKKDYEAVTKRVDSVNMVFNEAKARQKMAMEEKRQLQRDLTRAKCERTKLSKQLGHTQHRYQYQ